MAMTDNLEKLLKDGADSARLRFGLGSAYFNQGQFIEAIPHLQACIAMDPNYTAAYKLLGKALLKTGDSVAAKAPCVRLVVTLIKSSFIEQRAREE